MGIRLVVEWVDLEVPRGAVHGDGFGERSVRLEPQHVARLPRGQGLEFGEQATLTLVRERSEVQRATVRVVGSACAVPAGR